MPCPLLGDAEITVFAFERAVLEPGRYFFEDMLGAYPPPRLAESWDPGSEYAVLDRVLRALNRLFHPLHGGVDGHGWPMGRAVQLQEVAAALAWIPGVNLSEEVTIRLFPANWTTGERDQAVDRFPLPRNGLVHSYQHEVWVQ